MPALHDIQRDFAHAVLCGDFDAIAGHVEPAGLPAAHRLSIYRNTARTGMTEALRLAHPAVDRLVGPDFFEMAAARFARVHPPESSCLNDYGAGFAAFLAAMPECAALPYLQDVARFEWALNVAAWAGDVPPVDMLALADVAPALHESLRFVPHPSVTLLALSCPADRITDAVLSGDAAAMAALDPDAGPVWLVVHRGPDGVAAERLGVAEHGFLRRLLAGEPFAVLAHAGPDAAAILARQFTLGRIAGFTTNDTASRKDP